MPTPAGPVTSQMWWGFFVPAFCGDMEPSAVVLAIPEAPVGGVVLFGMSTTVGFPTMGTGES